MVDSQLVAARIAAVRDAVARIRDVLPRASEDFATDRTAREVVVLNLFVAIQECLTLATHWISDAGWAAPASYRETFEVLAERGVLEPSLARRMSAASGLRNLIGHRYAALDAGRIHAVARDDLGDLLEFCSALSRAIESHPGDAR